MFPIPREIVESATSVVCSSEWISERKTYFHEYVDAARLLAGGFGVRFPTEGRSFSLIINRPDLLSRAQSTSYS
jgi:hypothetical protein